MKNEPGRGRRAGQPETRGAILEAARRQFLDEGYQAVTMRSIAAHAGVDAALISYFFGSKRGVFTAAMSLAVNPADVISEALDGDFDGIPERLLRALLTTWDDPELGAPLRTLVRGISQDEGVTRLLRGLLERELIGQVAARLSAEHGRAITARAAQRRAGLFACQLAGLIFARYLIELGPVASAPIRDLVADYTPALSVMLAPPRPARPRPSGSTSRPSPSR